MHWMSFNDSILIDWVLCPSQEYLSYTSYVYQACCDLKQITSFNIDAELWSGGTAAFGSAGSMS